MKIPFSVACGLGLLLGASAANAEPVGHFETGVVIAQDSHDGGHSGGHSGGGSSGRGGGGHHDVEDHGDDHDHDTHSKRGPRWRGYGNLGRGGPRGGHDVEHRIFNHPGEDHLDGGHEEGGHEDGGHGEDELG
jgi:hypothetical protein